MSGPKITAYSLTGRAREIVLGQMRCEQQSLACAARTREILKGLGTWSEQLDRLLRNLELLTRRSGEGAERLAELSAAREMLHSAADQIASEVHANMPSRSAKYQITEEALTEKQAELQTLQAIRTRAESLQLSLEEILEKGTDLSRESGISVPSAEADVLLKQNKQIGDRVLRGILEDLNGVYSFENPEEPEAPETDFTDCRAAMNRELSAMLSEAALPAEFAKSVRQAIERLQGITEMQNLTSFDSITVRALRKRIEAFRKRREQRVAAWEEQLSRYRALCLMVGEEEKELPFSDEAESALAQEIARLELLALHQREQAYIADCVDEVMEEMGYDLIGTREVRKRSGKRFRNELFTFSEGTAVNVTFSSDGQISMELGGLAREDRIPSAEEAEMLQRDMESFCGEFAEFERRMRARGVIVGERIALSPPSEEYAAIINVNDYALGAGAAISEWNGKAKRRKAAEMKTMQKED